MFIKIDHDEVEIDSITTDADGEEWVEVPLRIPRCLFHALHRISQSHRKTILEPNGDQRTIRVFPGGATEYIAFLCRETGWNQVQVEEMGPANRAKFQAQLEAQAELHRAFTPQLVTRGQKG